MTPFTLRPLQSSDSDLILRWRNSDRIRAVMYTDQLIKPEDHAAWFSRLPSRADVAYRLFELDHRPVGLVYFTEIDPKAKSCTWGFYLGEEGLPKGAGSQLGILALDFVFNELKIETVHGESFAFNQAAVALHRKLGFDEKDLRKSAVIKDGKPQDVSVFELKRAAWQTKRNELLRSNSL